ncbi:MAG: hypothetical protein KAY55_05720 [Deltaproteobacteria bacterium]|nr:hypothetical protein [Deltaproteobacteria bacterium]
MFRLGTKSPATTFGNGFWDNDGFRDNDGLGNNDSLGNNDGLGNGRLRQSRSRDQWHNQGSCVWCRGFLDGT